MPIIATKKINEIKVELHIWGYQGHWEWRLFEVCPEGELTIIGVRKWATTKKDAERNGREELRKHERSQPRRNLAGLSY
jgi:hypothetical protein